MIRAFIAGLAIAILAPFIGIFMVVKRYSLMADTLSHISLVGIAAGILAGFNPIVGALVVAVAAAIGIDRLREAKQLFGESVLALFLSGSLALATILLSIGGKYTANILSFLFGSITTVQNIDVIIIVSLSVVVLITLLFFYRQLFAVAFDEEMAEASGIRARLFSAVLVVLAAVTVALSIRIVGALLVGALMVVPVLSAIQFGRSFKRSILLSILFSLVAVVVGLFLSFYIGLPTGGTIVIVALGIFMISLAVGL
ncbi:MAG: metal ABC transporter permease [Candidatus Andersenbacteria bacterium]|nr:metal ABC transporter permease [bacterium]MDZ4225263.1 metal ABC transporter permease [Candidatus Andersenbacteria bacterium]